MGNRLIKENKQTKEKQIYIRDAQGNVMAIYKDTHDSLILEELHIYGSQRLGVIKENRLLAKYVNIFPPSSTFKTSMPNTPLIPYPYTLAPYHFGKKHYELTDWLGNVRVVINDKKTPLGTNPSDMTYAAQVLEVNDYYPFGMLSRNYFVSEYRYGFNRKENDDEIIGKGRWQDYGVRMYRTDLGRFFSPDPLIVFQKKYPELSSYQFASNRPIEGIDLEGREYLNANESRIEVVGGAVKLKVENFLFLNKIAFKNANNNPQNWKKGEIGINTTIGYLKMNSYFLNSNLSKGNVNAEYPDRAPSVSSTYDDSNPTVYAHGGTRVSAGLVGLVNVANFALEQIGIFSAFYDIIKVEQHLGILESKVRKDITKAIEKGLVPQKYQNPDDIGSIMNVVLQGVNNTDNKEIYEIGMKIWNTISNPPAKKNIPPKNKKEAAPRDKTNVSKPRLN